jgi:chromosome segregation ATPase
VQSLERKDQEYIQYEQRTKGKEGMYHAQIQKLKDQVADHNELAETSKNQSIEIRNLNQRCDEKEKTIQLLDMVKVDLANVKQEHKQSKKSIQSVEARNEQLAHEIENGLMKEKSYKDTIGKLENEKGNLKSEVNGLESRLTYKDNELDKCSAEIKRCVSNTS